MLGISSNIVISIIVIVVFLLLFFVSWSQIERGRKINLRPLQSLVRLRRLIQNTAENGTKVHYSPGNGSLSGKSGGAESLSGLTALSTVQTVAARSKGHVTTSTNDALSYLLAADVASNEYERVGRTSDYRPEDVRFVTQQENMAFSAGMASILSEPNVSGSAVIGHMGPEYLLVGDLANQKQITQIAGSTQAEALPIMIASAGFENVLLGEEVYAAPAYLDRQPAHLASLQAQDILRLLIIAGIIIGVVAATLGYNVGDLFLK
jgi:hypothetical protein